MCLVYALQQSENGHKKGTHCPFEVECRSCEHDVDGVSEKSPVKVAPEAVVRFEVADYWLYPGSLAEAPVLFLPLVGRVRGVGRVRYLYLGLPQLPFATVAPVTGQNLDGGKVV